MKSTTNYDMFKFRDDNREEGVKRTRVEKLKASIQSHNLLHLRPIAVNKDMEIIDGQHRCIAAKELNLSIFYEVDENLKDEDIILMNNQSPWGTADYYNYYVKHNYPEYLKLNKFIKDNGLSLSIALRLMSGGHHQPKEEFRTGKFIFKEETAKENYTLGWQTIQTIERLIGTKQYLKNGKVWQALLMLFKHPNFNESKWFRNLEMLVDKITQKVSSLDYFLLFKEIHNYRNQNRIEDIEIVRNDL